MKAFRSALRSRPGYLDAGLNLAETLEREGRCEAARAVLEDMLERHPTAIEPYFYLADLLVEMGEPHAAIEVYRAVSEIHPSLPQPYLERVWLMTPDQSRQIFSVLEQGLRNQPDNAMLWREYGMVSARAGRTISAINALETALLKDPSLPGTRYVLGGLLAGRDPETARQHLERELELSPDDAETHHVLALLLAEHGRTERARGLLARALEIDPGRVRSMTALARLHIDAGRLESARGLLDRAATLSEDPGTLTRIEAMRSEIQ